MGMLSLFPLKDLSSLAFLSATPERNFQRFHGSNKHYINQGAVFCRVESKWLLLLLFFSKLYFNKGYHGFGNVHMNTKTIVRAFSPDFKKNHLLPEHFDSMQIYLLMCKLLGVTPKPHNSSLAITQEMLADSYDQQPGEIQKQSPGNWWCGLFCHEIQKIRNGVSRWGRWNQAG